MRIGIIGQGYVGTAVKNVFEKHYEVETYDLDKDKCSVDYGVNRFVLVHLHLFMVMWNNFQHQKIIN